MNKFTFIDLFAGIGGFHLAAKRCGGECVFACEINEQARRTYKANHEIEDRYFAKDIASVNPMDIPDFDVLFAGFPCQPFSTMGIGKGFEDARGTAFFYIAKILEQKRPRAFFLENVRNLGVHDGGRTLAIIKSMIEQLGYSFDYQIMKACDYGLPQFRARLFMVGFQRSEKPFEFPEKEPLEMTMDDIMGGHCDRAIGWTLRCGGAGSKINDVHNWDGYMVDGVERRLTTAEKLRMMGYPNDFKMPVSTAQATQQIGNSVAIPPVQKTIMKIAERLANG